MSTEQPINPDSQLLPEIARRLREARKTKSILAKQVEVVCAIETLEGRFQAQPGDYLCRGIVGEQWPQKESKLLEKYVPSGQIDEAGWQRFDPKSDSEAVEATQIDHSFRVIAQWGELTGKANDYVVRSNSDPKDVWIVDKDIFEASYEFLTSVHSLPTCVSNDSERVQKGANTIGIANRKVERTRKQALLYDLRRCWRWINKHSANLVLGLALTTFATAFTGVSIASKATDANQGTILSLFNWLTDKLYESAQAMFLNMEPHTDNFNVWIGIARVSAVMLVVLVATQAIGRLFKDSLDDLRLRFRGKRNVLVGGLGRIGFQLATDYANQGKLVVVQEISGADYWSLAAEDAGAIVIEGDVTDINSLREHIFRDPETIHLVTGNDLANINALANVRSLRREYLAKFGNPLGAAECYVHIDDPGLQRTLNRCLIESTCGSDDSLNVHVFNIYHETACQLIIDHLTPLRPRDRDEVALYIVFGFEQMGTAMVKELAEYAHFENQKRSRILVLTPNAEDECERCLAQWSRLSPHVVHADLRDASFDPQCDEWTSQAARPRIVEKTEADPKAVEYAANVHFCEMKNTDTLSISDMEQLVRIATEAGVRPVTLFCFEDDEKNFRLASELNDTLQDFHGINRTLGPDGEVPEAKKPLHQRQEELHIPIFTFLPRSRPLREILSETKEQYPLRAFGAVHEGLSRAHDDAVEQIAMDIAWSYDCSQRGLDLQQPKAKASNATTLEVEQYPRSGYLKEWRRKTYWEQHSNLTAAEHAWIKVQMLGLTIAQGKNSRGSSTIDFERFDEREKVTIALVEHNRWMAERLLMGWCYGPKMAQPPQRPSICPKSDLPDEELLKDFRQVKAVLDFLQQRGAMFHPARTPASHSINENAITLIVN